MCCYQKGFIFSFQFSHFSHSQFIRVRFSKCIIWCIRTVNSLPIFVFKSFNCCFSIYSFIISVDISVTGYCNQFFPLRVFTSVFAGRLYWYIRFSLSCSGSSWNAINQYRWNFKSANKILLTVRLDNSKADICLCAERVGECTTDCLTVLTFSGFRELQELPFNR